MRTQSSKSKRPAKKPLISSPATKRLKKADQQIKTRASAAAKTPARAPKKTAKTQRRAGSPLSAISTENRRTHRSATARRLGPASISGGV